MVRIVTLFLALCGGSMGLNAQTIIGDAMPTPLAEKGDAARGRAIVVDRQKGFCLLCHAGPFPEQRFMGNIGPDLTGVGQRYNEGQLRLRIAAPSALAPQTIMPSYFVTDGLVLVAKPFRDKPLLDAQQIEDVVAFLASLTEPNR